MFLQPLLAMPESDWKLCLIKFELEVNVYNFRKYWILIVVSLQKVHFYTAGINLGKWQYLPHYWSLGRGPGVARGKKNRKNLELNTIRPPMSVHKKIQPIRSSRLAGYWWHINECLAEYLVGNIKGIQILKKLCLVYVSWILTESKGIKFVCFS